jgi:hypothetical protein
MKRVWISLAFLASAGGSQLGCGDACDNANNRIIARYKDCNFDESETSQEPADPVCTDADATYLDCRANCAESATCEALHGDDPQRASDFGACNAMCE